MIESVLEYPFPIAIEEVNVFVDISKTYEAKKRALAQHKSQEGKQYMTEAHLDIFHGNTYASLHGFPCSEAYELVRGFY